MDTTTGAELQARMDQIAIPKRDFAERAGIDRGTLDRVLADDERVTVRTRAKVENTLADLEDEIGMAESGRLVVTTVEYDGARVTVRGEPDDVAETVRQILRNR